MLYWPVGDFYDNTTRVVGEQREGYIDKTDAQKVIDALLGQQTKPHHVTYRVESALSLAALLNSGVLV